MSCEEMQYKGKREQQRLHCRRMCSEVPSKTQSPSLRSVPCTHVVRILSPVVAEVMVVNHGGELRRPAEKVNKHMKDSRYVSACVRSSACTRS
jgi:hypothetical protein